MIARKIIQEKIKSKKWAKENGLFHITGYTGVIWSKSVLIDEMTICKGGIPWFVLTISIWQISYFCYLYGSANPPVETWWKWDKQFQYNRFIFDRHMAIGYGEFWRFYTYAFVHAGLGLIRISQFMLLCFDINLKYFLNLKILNRYSVDAFLLYIYSLYNIGHIK